jgi:hypothetical protein
MLGREVDLAIDGLKTFGLWKEEIQLGNLGRARGDGYDGIFDVEFTEMRECMVALLVRKLHVAVVVGFSIERMKVRCNW